jgi:hypothetical protein
MQVKTSKKARRAIVCAAALVVLVVASIAAAAGGEGPVTVTVGNLKVTADGDITPETFPRSKFAPAGFWAEGKIATLDGTHLPAAKTFVIQGDKNVALTVKGYPTCSANALQSRDTKAAEKACGPAIVGTGQATAEVAFPEQPPILAKSKILAINGGEKGGVVTLYVHAFLSAPVAAAIVTVVKIKKIHDGRYGTLSTSTIPKIAGGAGSVKSFTLKLDKKWIYNGRKMSLISAKCPDGKLQANIEANFSDGTKAGATIIRTCTPKG